MGDSKLVALVSMSVVLRNTADSVDETEVSLLEVVEMIPGVTSVTTLLVVVLELEGWDEDTDIASPDSELETEEETDEAVVTVLLEVEVVVSASEVSSETRAVEVVLRDVLVSGSGDVEAVDKELVELLSPGS